MPKVQDLFKRADGSKLLDVKLRMQLKEIPSEPIIKTTLTGEELKLFPLTLEYNGEQYEWELNDKQLSRIFTKTTKSGDVTWQAKPGDIVNVWYASNKKMPSRPYYDAEPDTNEALLGVAAAEDVFDLVPEKKTLVPTPKPHFVKTSRASSTETKWDGTPRQSSFRQGYAGMIQAILCNPSINPRNPEDITFALSLAREMVKEVRVGSKVLEEEVID